MTSHPSPLPSPLSPLTPGGATICALATAPGGALGIIRVSGAGAFEAVSALSSLSCDAAKANTVHLAKLYSPLHSGRGEGEGLHAEGQLLDEALVTVFRAPHSYTGEDSVELSCHGSPYILNKVLELLIQHGCRMARPGEFTMRAYLNGKLDLSQAEAVADLIASNNKATHDIALSQLRGGISGKLSQLRAQLLKLTSLLELELDFSDHEELEFADRSELLGLAQTIDDRITHLAKSFETGQALKQGIPVAIVGKTNVGKSTLLNALLKDERAIVSDIHGTTRDTIEDTIDIHGVTFRFIDTAGIRQTDDKVEQIGIQRTYAAIGKARVVVWLFDEPPTEAEAADIAARCEGRALIPIWNKADLSPQPSPLTPHLSALTVIPLSAKHGTNLDVLEAAIYKAAGLPTLSETDVIVTSSRHYESLVHAHDNLSRVLSGLEQQLSGDLIAEDLRLVLSDLAEITGEGQITPQETLNTIFSHFCIGK